MISGDAISSHPTVHHRREIKLKKKKQSLSTGTLCARALFTALKPKPALPRACTISPQNLTVTSYRSVCTYVCWITRVDSLSFSLQFPHKYFGNLFFFFLLSRLMWHKHPNHVKNFAKFFDATARYTQLEKRNRAADRSQIERAERYWQLDARDESGPAKSEVSDVENSK